MRFFVHRSEIILTHCSEGIEFIKEYLNIENKRIIFLHHPAKIKNNENILSNKEFDIVIWGSIQRYKGIDCFLEFLHTSKLQNKYKILIFGKTESISLHNKILSLLTPNISYFNTFLTNEKKDEILSISKIILFPYLTKSILSSGILMDSLNYDNSILAPNIGAFRDLAKRNLIEVYRDMKEMINKIDLLLIDNIDDRYHRIKKRTEFINRHNWITFGHYISKELIKL